MFRLFRRNGDNDFEARLEAAREAFLAGPVQPLRHRGTLRPPRSVVAGLSAAEPDLELVATALGHDLTLVALWTGPDDVTAAHAVEVLEDGSTVARSRAPWPYAAVATWHGPSPRPPVVIEDLDVAFPILAPLPEGGLVIAGSRCRVRSGTPERNAMIYGESGFVERDGVMGDGIEDIQISPSGRILVSYFDEGITGANGWSSQSIPPVGASGLVEFSAMLAPIWTYAPPRGMPPIADCLAMNVAEEALWTSYYADFPIVRVDPNMATTYWRSGVRGIRGLAVSGERVALVGGYPPYDNRLTVGELGTDRLHIVSESRLVLPDGSEVPESARVICRNDRMIVIVGREVFGLDIADLP